MHTITKNYQLIMDAIYIMSTPKRAKRNLYRMGGYGGTKESLLSDFKQIHRNTKLFFFCKVPVHNVPPRELFELLKDCIVVKPPYNIRWCKLELSKCISALAKAYNLNEEQICAATLIK